MDWTIGVLANDYNGADHVDTDIVWTVDTFMNDTGQRSKWFPYSYSDKKSDIILPKFPYHHMADASIKHPSSGAHKKWLEQIAQILQD